MRSRQTGPIAAIVAVALCAVGAEAHNPPDGPVPLRGTEEAAPETDRKRLATRSERLGPGSSRQAHVRRRPDTVFKGPVPLRRSTDEPHKGEEGEGGVETEDLFGFTAGSDVQEKGETELSSETVLRLGKRGSYRALDQKLEFGVGAADGFSVSLSTLGACHRVRSVPDLDDLGGRCSFNGFGGEFRLGLLDRKHGPFGITLQIEPSVVRVDERSGKSGHGFGSENKLIFDRELAKDLFGAINLLYDVETFRERSAAATERGSTAGVAGALTYQVAPGTFVGGELRYLRAYEGLALQRFSGDAVYLGPTLFRKLSDKAWLSLAWNMQVAGYERPDDATSLPLPRQSGLNLRDFERHQIRVKAGLTF